MDEQIVMESERQAAAEQASGEELKFVRAFDFSDDSMPKEGVSEDEMREVRYEAVLPEEYEDLRQYLRNDGFLADEEINQVLRNGTLNREELRQKLMEKPELGDETTREKLLNYLCELHETVKDLPLDEIALESDYKVKKEDSKMPVTAKRQEKEEPEKKKSLTDSLPAVQIIRGSLIANFMHNYRLNARKANQVQHCPTMTVSNTRYQWEQVSDQLKQYGITRQKLEESGQLTDFLNGRKTGLVGFNRDFGGQQANLTGKLYIVNTPDRGPRVHFQSQQKTLVIPEVYLGHTFTDEDRQRLKEKGELGKQVELKDNLTGLPFKAYVGVDKETNALQAYRRDRLTIPTTIKGVRLTPEQQELLEKGDSIRLTGMMGENGQRFDADVQISAAKKGFQFTAPEQIKQTVDLETAREQQRPDNELLGTAPGASAKTAAPAVQQREKAVSQQEDSQSPKSRVKGASLNGTKQPSPTKDKGRGTKKKAQNQEPGMS